MRRASPSIEHAKAGFGEPLERFVRKALRQTECMSAEGNRWHRPAFQDGFRKMEFDSPSGCFLRLSFSGHVIFRVIENAHLRPQAAAIEARRRNSRQRQLLRAARSAGEICSIPLLGEANVRTSNNDRPGHFLCFGCVSVRQSRSSRAE